MYPCFPYRTDILTHQHASIDEVRIRTQNGSKKGDQDDIQNDPCRPYKAAAAAHGAYALRPCSSPNTLLLSRPYPHVVSEGYRTLPGLSNLVSLYHKDAFGCVNRYRTEHLGKYHTLESLKACFINCRTAIRPPDYHDVFKVTMQATALEISECADE